MGQSVPRPPSLSGDKPLAPASFCCSSHLHATRTLSQSSQAFSVSPSPAPQRNKPNSYPEGPPARSSHAEFHSMFWNMGEGEAWTYHPHSLLFSRADGCGAAQRDEVPAGWLGTRPHDQPLSLQLSGTGSPHLNLGVWPHLWYRKH